MSKWVYVVLPSCFIAALAAQSCSSKSSTEDGAGGSAGAAAGGSSGGKGGEGGAGTQGGTAGQSSAGGAAGGGAGGAGGNSGGVGGNSGGAAGGSAGATGGAGGTAMGSAISFFLTSANPGMGADLGGLEGADAYCKTLATTAGAGNRQWRAYLSTDTVDAKSRIGNGPWQNQKGLVVATSVADLHSANNKLSLANSIDEKGRAVATTRHDIITGSNEDGTKRTGANCTNWTSSAEQGKAVVGHHNRAGGGESPMSWNAAHESSGCSLAKLISTAGDGLFYCFAAD